MATVYVVVGVAPDSPFVLKLHTRPVYLDDSLCESGNGNWWGKAEVLREKPAAMPLCH